MDKMISWNDLKPSGGIERGELFMIGGYNTQEFPKTNYFQMKLIKRRLEAGQSIVYFDMESSIEHRTT